MAFAETRPVRSVPAVWVPATLLVVWFLGPVAPDVRGWGGEHHSIARAAVAALPAAEQHLLAAETPALVATYCGFPDVNWPCYGEWGGGSGDAQAARFPDTRREWDVSYYCGWDPVLRTGKGYPHAPPGSCAAASSLFLKAVAAYGEGRAEDGARFLGAMLHYIQDSGSFPHVQPMHRSFHVQNQSAIGIAGYGPAVLGATPAEAAQALAERVRRLTEWTENRGSPLFEAGGVPLAEAKRLCAQETMVPGVVKAVEAMRRTKPTEFEATALDCANECARACADAIHSALGFAAPAAPGPETVPSGTNLVFNPSFEEDDGDRVPDGWYVGWLDLTDRAGRAEWYRAGTHWEKHVRGGQYAALLLWAPAKGLEWRQTWRRAICVQPGATYRAAAWVQASAGSADCHVGLEFSDAAYQPLVTATSQPLAGAVGWTRLSADAAAPEQARWARLILHSAATAGAVWFDDVEVSRLP